MSALGKLPPQVARELRRHISPTPLSKQPPGVPTQIAGSSGSNNNSVKYVLAGCIALTATAASFPLIASWWLGNLNAKDAPLTAAQNRRGAFLNSGSKDVGRDPNWDFQKGYTKESRYKAVEEEVPEGKKKPLPAAFLPFPAEYMDKHDKDCEDFAKGRKRSNASSSQ